MDIEISSNFERLLFDLHGRDGAHLAQRMAEFRSSKSLTLSPVQHADLTALFAAHATDDAATLAIIKRVYAECGYLLDPHSATGVAATEALAPQGVTVTLATAHPAKFPEAVREATGFTPPLPAHLADLYERVENIVTIARDAATLKTYIESL